MLMQYLLQACRGKFLWERLKKQYGPGNWPSRYILFPSKDDIYNAWGLCYLTRYLEKNNFDKVMAVVTDEGLKGALSNIKHNNLHIISIEKKQMDCLIRLCALVDLNTECTIVSVKEPYDTGAERLLGKKGTTKRDIVWYDIYKMSTQPEAVKLSAFAEWIGFEQYRAIIYAELTKEKAG